jgi:hypothetical protein
MIKLHATHLTILVKVVSKGVPHACPIFGHVPNPVPHEVRDARVGDLGAIGDLVLEDLVTQNSRHHK